MIFRSILLLIRWELIGQDDEEMPEPEAIAAVFSGEDPSPPRGGEAGSSSLEGKEEPRRRTQSGWRRAQSVDRRLERTSS